MEAAAETEAFDRVTRKGDEIRRLKSEGMPKEHLQQHVDELLALKDEYAAIAGKAYVSPTIQSKPSKAEVERPEVPGWSNSKENEDIAFKRYHSIENHTDRLTRQMLQDEELVRAEWFALEKVHGANFSLSTDGTVVTPARRTAILRPGETFYNFETVLAMYIENVRAFFVALSGHTEHGQLVNVRMFGELYGGLYRGQVSPPGAKPPNKDIMYCPHNDWVVFDAQATWQLGERVYRLWLDHEMLIELCKSVQLPVVPILHRGTLAELLEIDPLFITTMPATFHPHLPALEGNYAEGFILKSSRTSKAGRSIIKFKNSRFIELHNAGYKVPPKRAQKQADPEVIALKQEILPYISRERLVNVCSKLTEQEASISGRLRAELINDAIESFLKASCDDDDTDRVRETSMRKKLKHALEKAANKVVASYLEEEDTGNVIVS